MRKRRTRAVALGTLLAIVCLLALPAESGALPYKWWLYPTVGDPDGPGGTGLQTWRFGSLTLALTSLRGYWFSPLIIVPISITRSDRSAGR